MVLAPGGLGLARLEDGRRVHEELLFRLGLPPPAVDLALGLLALRLQHARHHAGGERVAGHLQGERDGLVVYRERLEEVLLDVVRPIGAEVA